MDKVLNLHQRKAAVMLAVKSIPTNGWNAFGKYKYATQSDVWNTMRLMLAEHGLDFAVSDKEHFWDAGKNRTRLTVEIELTNIDNPDDSVVVTVNGEANDKTDKGIAKARSAAIKYWLLHTFLIATGSEADDADSGPEPAAKEQTRPRPPELSTMGQKTQIKALMKTLGYKNVDAALVERRFPALMKLSGEQAKIVIEKLQAKVKENE